MNATTSLVPAADSTNRVTKRSSDALNLSRSRSDFIDRDLECGIGNAFHHTMFSDSNIVQSNPAALFLTRLGIEDTPVAERIKAHSDSFNVFAYGADSDAQTDLPLQSILKNPGSAFDELASAKRLHDETLFTSIEKSLTGDFLKDKNVFFGTSLDDFHQLDFKVIPVEKTDNSALFKPEPLNRDLEKLRVLGSQSELLIQKTVAERVHAVNADVSLGAFTTDLESEFKFLIELSANSIPVMVIPLVFISKISLAEICNFYTSSIFPELKVSAPIVRLNVRSINTFNLINFDSNISTQNGQIEATAENIIRFAREIGYGPIKKKTSLSSREFVSRLSNYSDPSYRIAIRSLSYNKVNNEFEIETKSQIKASVSNQSRFEKIYNPKAYPQILDFDRMVYRIFNSSSPLNILMGEAGSGKTSLIISMLNQQILKKLELAPFSAPTNYELVIIDNPEVITAEKFSDFIQQNLNKPTTVVLMDDFDSVLSARANEFEDGRDDGRRTNNEFMRTMLTLLAGRSNGLEIRCKMFVTTNMGGVNIDRALMRKGRTQFVLSLNRLDRTLAMQSWIDQGGAEEEFDHYLTPSAEGTFSAAEIGNGLETLEEDRELRELGLSTNNELFVEGVDLSSIAREGGVIGKQVKAQPTKTLSA